MKEDIFYTLTGYQQRENKILTSGMEDYLEMTYRIFLEKRQVSMKDLAQKLHVKASSVTKMMTRLKNANLIEFEKYGLVFLTDFGMLMGKYLLHRHNVLVSFFALLNGPDYQLSQVEKIEHFVDLITIHNMEKFIETHSS